MSKPPSNSRRFVNAAWSLLTFQLIASAGAVAVTGVAAFHVNNLMRGQQASGPVEAAVEQATEAPAAADPAAPATDAAPALPPPPPPVAPAGPVNDGPGTLSLASDERGNIIASLRDPDGVSQGPRIQWYRNGAHVPYASGATYSIRYDDSQAAITARAEYVDGDGFSENVSGGPLQVGVIIP